MARIIDKIQNSTIRHYAALRLADFMDKIDHQDILLRIALNTDETLCRKAVEKIRDADTLKKVITGEADCFCKYTAVYKLPDERFIADLTIKNYFEAEYCAIGNQTHLNLIDDMKNQAELTRIGKLSNNEQFRARAFCRKLELWGYPVGKNKGEFFKCGTCTEMGRLRALFLEKAILKHYGKLNIDIEDHYYPQDYSDGRILICTKWAQTLKLRITDKKGKVIVQEEDLDFEFQHKAGSCWPIKADINWNRIGLDIIKPLDDKLEKRLAKEYRFK